MRKRLLSSFLCLCMVLALLPTAALAAAEITTISSLRELVAFRDSVNAGNRYQGKTVTLTADIDLGGEANPWTPIHSFLGTFDGNGHTISGLYINDPYGIGGLFRSVGAEGVWGGTDQSGTVKNLSVRGRMTCSYGGGIVAQLCGTLENCHSAVTVEGNARDGACFGGLVGNAGGGSIIRRCYYTGKVEVTAGATDIIYVGGIVGLCTGTSSILDCYNTGRVTLTTKELRTRQFVGGIAGYYKVESRGPQMLRCYNVGTVSASEQVIVGSLIGHLVNYVTGQIVVERSYALEGTAEKTLGNLGSVTGFEGAFRTDQELKCEDTFLEWDLDTVWELPLAGDYLYPMLRNAPGRPPVVPAVVLTDDDVYLAEGSAQPELMDYVKGYQGTVSVSPAAVDTGALRDQRVTYTASIPGFEDVSASLVIHILPQPAALTKTAAGGSGPFPLSSTMTYTGGLTYTETGFVYGALQNPTLTLNDGVVKTVSAVNTKGGSLTASVAADRLAEGIVYYARAYAKADDGTVIYGPQSDGFGLGVPSYGSFSVVNNGNNTFTIRRTGGSDGVQKVYYRTQNGSAVGGTHFTHQNGTLTFGDGESSKTVTVSEQSVTTQHGGKVSTAYSNAERVYFLDIYRVEGGATLSDTDRAARTMAKNGDYTVVRSAYTDWKQNYFNADQHTITDKGWDQNYEIHINDVSYGSSAQTNTYLKSTATHYQLYLKMEVREEDDGNQHMRVLNQYGNATTNDRWQIRDGSKGSSWRSDAYFPSSTATGSMNDIINQNWACDGAMTWTKGVSPEYLSIGNGDPGQIIVGFDASGGGADDWCIRNVYQYARPGDEKEPQLLGVAPMDSSTYLPGEKFTLALVFDEIVDSQNSSLGVDTSKITTGWGTLSYAGGADTNVLYFTGTVPEGADGTITLTGLDCAGQIKDMCATAGTQSAGSGSANVTVGSNPKPTVSVGAIANSNGTLSATITAQNAGKLEYVWGNAATAPVAGWQMLANTASSAVTTRQTEGTWYLHARATNADGRVIYARSATPVTLTAEAGGTGTPVIPPNLTVTADNSAWAKTRSIAVTHTPADATVTVKTPAGVTETVGDSYTATQNGVYTFTLTSGDETVTQMAAVSRLDNTAPTINVGDLAVTRSTRAVTLTVAAEDKGSGVASVTGTWGSETAVFTDNGDGTWTTTSPDRTGSWTLSVTAADRVGNTAAATSAAYTINADRPAVAVQKQSEDGHGVVYTYTVDAKENTGVSVSLPDGTVTDALTGSVTLTAPGNYYIYVTDDLDHFVTSSPLTVAETVDGDAPVILGRVDSMDWTTQDVAVGLVIQEQGSLAGVTLNGAALEFRQELGEYAASFTAEENGTYTVTATDAAGNVGTADFTIGWIDKTLPTVTVTGLPEDYATQAHAVTLTATDAASGVQSAQYAMAESKESVPDSLTSLPEDGQVTVSGNGVHYIYYKAVDNAGNILEGWTEAIIIAQPYAVRFHANGGSGSMADLSFASWDQAQALTANAFAAPAEKRFKEWNTKADGSGTGYTDKAVVSKLAYEGIFELYAQWADCDHQWGAWTLNGSEAKRTCQVNSNHTQTKALTVTLDKASYEYSGKDNEPTVTVQVDGKALTKDTDFTVTYADNVDAGTATVTITGKGGYAGSVDKTFTITAKSITAKSATATSRDYDGTASVAVTFVVLDGVVGEDAVGVNTTDLKGTVSAPDVGSYTRVTLQNLTLTGDAAGNYTLTQPNVTLPAQVTISKAQPPAATAVSRNITNNLEKEYTFALANLLPQLNAAGITENRKDWGVPIYTIQSVDFTKDGYYNTDSAFIERENGAAILHLPILFNNVEYTDTVGAVTIEIKSANYETFTNVLHIKASNKAHVGFAGIQIASRVYNGQPIAYTGTLVAKTTTDGADVTASIPEENIEIRYQGVDGTSYSGDRSKAPPINAGSFVMIVRVVDRDANYIGVTQFPFQIEKAAGVGSVTMADFSCGQTPSVPAAASATNPGDVRYEYKAKGADDDAYSTTKPAAAGEYTVRATFPAATNYETVTATDDFTISHAYAGEWSFDETRHWHECPCGDKTDEGGHVYDGHLDETCNACRYIRTLKDPVIQGVVEVRGEDTPAVSVDENTVKELAGKAENNTTVTVKLTVEKQDEPAHKNELTALVAGKKDDVLFLDLALTKTVDDGENGPVTSSITDTGEKVLEIAVPYDFTGKQNVTVYRKHENEAAQALAKLDDRPAGDFQDGSFFADSEGGEVYIYASKFSTYAIGYTVSRPSGSSTTYYTLAATAGEGGAIAPSGKVRVLRNRSETFAITPNEGYVVADVLVDGKSVGAVTEYIFDKATANHTIEASFKKAGALPAWNPFEDVKAGSWFHDNVKVVYEQGMMVGTDSTHFAPSMTASRAMIATILWRLSGSPEPKAALTYPDCVAGSWYAKAVAWATEAGVVKGYDTGDFGPDDPITREQMALMLWRYAGEPETSADLSAFVDGESVSAWVYPAMEWAVEQGILTGKSGSILDPTGQATRAEVATMLGRFAEKNK